MKKYIVIFSFLILSSYIAISQEFKAGLTAGINAAQVDGDRMSGFYKAGFSGGLFVYRDFGNLSRFQVEFLYSNKGSKTSPKSTYPDLWQVSTTNIEVGIWSSLVSVTLNTPFRKLFYEMFPDDRME